MKKITLRHEINCSADDFWKVFFDKTFNETLFRDELHFPQFEILQQEEKDNGDLYRKVRGQPKMNLPKAVEKVLGKNFGYEEEGKFDASTKTWRFEMHPNTLADKLRNAGTVTVEPIGDDKCRRIAEIEMEAKVLGVGSLIEKTTEQEMRQGWDHSATFMNKWIAEHPPS